MCAICAAQRSSLFDVAPSRFAYFPFEYLNLRILLKNICGSNFLRRPFMSILRTIYRNKKDIISIVPVNSLQPLYTIRRLQKAFFFDCNIPLLSG